MRLLTTSSAMEQCFYEWEHAGDMIQIPVSGVSHYSTDGHVVVTHQEKCSNVPVKTVKKKAANK